MMWQASSTGGRDKAWCLHIDAEASLSSLQQASSAGPYLELRDRDVIRQLQLHHHLADNGRGARQGPTLVHF